MLANSFHITDFFSYTQKKKGRRENEFLITNFSHALGIDDGEVDGSVGWGT